MKVICIDSSDSNKGYGPAPFEFGEVLTASQCPAYVNNYDIAEYPSHPNGNAWSFPKSRFIPLSDIDETELVQHRELEKVRELCGDRSSR